MLKALIKKEVLRFVANLTVRGGKSRKPNGKKHTKVQPADPKAGAISMIILWAFVLLSLAMAFAGTCHLFGEALLPVGLTWLYYVLVGVSGFIISIIGNSFTASAAIFKAKDNELLISMPIPVKYILLSRISLIWGMSFIFACIPMIPAMVVHKAIMGAIGSSVVISVILLIFVGSFLTTAVSALLGWALAAISKHIKNKSLATTAFTLIFLFGYYYVYFNIRKYLEIIAVNSIDIGYSIQNTGFAWPIYQFGRAAAGDFKALLLFTGMTLALFAAVYLLISANFVRIVTATEKGTDARFGEEEKKEQSNIKMMSPKKALLKKELKRFLSSPTYMINAGLGLILLLIASVALIVKRAAIIRFFGVTLPALSAQGELTDLIGRGLAALPVIAMALVWTLLSTVTIAAPSVSIEGNTLWILKSLPVSTGDIFYAKKSLEFYLTMPFAAVLTGVLTIVLGFDYTTFMYMLISSLLFIQVHSIAGLMLDLKHAKLDWSSEAVPIKQNLSVVLEFFIGPLIAIAVAAVYMLLLYDKMGATDFMLGVLIMLVLVMRALNTKLNERGAALFAEL